MQRSPLVGGLLSAFLQDHAYDVLLIQDPPRQWLLKNPVPGFQLFKPDGLDSLAVIMVSCRWQASQSCGGTARVCVVEVGPPQEAVFLCRDMCNLCPGLVFRR